MSVPDTTPTGHPLPSPGHTKSPPTSKPGRLLAAWEGITRLGLAEFAFRLGTHVLLVTSILMVASGLRLFYSLANVGSVMHRNLAREASLPTATLSFQSVPLPAYDPMTLGERGLSRQASLHTDLPSRPRYETLQYITQEGDSLVTTAEKFGLKPETILWANQQVLNDNPHKFRPGQTLTILPVDGAYHRWSPGDNLEAVARFYHSSSETILSYPGNHLRPEEVGDLTNPVLKAGTWLIIPGGYRDFVTWRVPEIPLDKPEAAEILGSGACKELSEGPVGSGNFIWPTDAPYLSGYDYLPQANHFGIDTTFEIEQSAYAVDSGVVVYAGWNDWGYENMVIINHGNDWQTLYANLSDLYVVCGQIIWQGGVVGIIGGDSTSPTPEAGSPYLHFEMMYKGSARNPQDYLP